MTPELIQLLFILLFGMTVVAFIIAINSRGPVRMAFSYVLATALLVACVYESMLYWGESRLQDQLKRAQALEEARRLREQADQNQGALAAYGDFLKSLATRGKIVTVKMRNLNLEDETIDMEVYFAVASSASAEAGRLLRELEARKVPEEKFKGAYEMLKKGIGQTQNAAKYLNLYFKSENEEEEARRAQIYSSSIREAVYIFDQIDNMVLEKK